MKRLFWCLLGALWSAPLRLLTVPAMLAAMLHAGGGVLSTDSLTRLDVIMSGAVVGVLLRLADNLAVAFVAFPVAMQFPMVKRFFERLKQ